MCRTPDSLLTCLYRPRVVINPGSPLEPMIMFTGRHLHRPRLRATPKTRFSCTNEHRSHLPVTQNHRLLIIDCSSYSSYRFHLPRISASLIQRFLRPFLESRSVSLQVGLNFLQVCHLKVRGLRLVSYPSNADKSIHRCSSNDSRTLFRCSRPDAGRCGNFDRSLLWI